MSVKIQITIRVDEGSPKIAKIREALQDRTALHEQLGQEGEIQLLNHFRSRPPNKRGWPSQGFWARIAGVTAAQAPTKDGVSIFIGDEAFNQKLYGGTIRPRERKYLALPAIAAAYGKSPLDVPGLVAIFGRGRKLVGWGEVEGKKRTVWYWLVKSVTQRADPDALPPEAAYRAALQATVDDFFARL